MAKNLRLKIKILKSRLKQKDLAHILQRSESFISLIVNGYTPNTDMQEKICNVLNCKKEKIF